jgi:hypothetical protein
MMFFKVRCLIMALAAFAQVANCCQQWAAMIAEPPFAEHQSH